MGFKVLSEETRTLAKVLVKPETLVSCETDTLREREPSEMVHLRDDPEHILCIMCGKLATVWLTSKDRWERHAFSCRVVVGQGADDNA